MKEASGEVSMTVVTLIAIAVIGAIVATQWDNISGWITTMWGDTTCTDYNNNGSCDGDGNPATPA